MLNTVLLICCSWPPTISISLTPLMPCGENLTRPEPKIGGSRADVPNCLPYYTAGFK